MDSSKYYPIPHWIEKKEVDDATSSLGTTIFKLCVGAIKTDELNEQEIPMTKINRFYNEQISHIEEKIIFLNIETVTINDYRSKVKNAD